MDNITRTLAFVPGLSGPPGLDGPVEVFVCGTSIRAHVGGSMIDVSGRDVTILPRKAARWLRGVLRERRELAALVAREAST